MSRHSHSGHLRPRGAAWELRYRANGKLVTTTVRGTRKDAERELRKRLTAVDEGTHVDPSRITVAQWCERWLTIITAEVEAQTLTRYATIVHQHLAPAFGTIRLAKLSTETIQAQYAKWATSGRGDGKEGGLAPNTRRAIHGCLHSLLERAVEVKLLARNPAAMRRKRLPKASKKEMQILTPTQMQQVLDALAGDLLCLPVTIAMATGARRGEISALTWRKVDLARGMITISASVEETTCKIKGTKTDRARGVTLPGFAIEALRKHKLEQAQRLLMLGIRQGPDTPVCDRGDGAIIPPGSLSTWWRRLPFNKLGMPKVRFHDLRHSHASMLIAQNVPAKAISERLGHASISITMDTYGHLLPGMQENVAARFDDAWSGK